MTQPTFNNTTHNALFFEGANVANGNSFREKWSDVILSALRAVGVYDQIVINDTPPSDTTALWLDTRPHPDEPSVLRRFRTGLTEWTPVTNADFSSDLSFNTRADFVAARLSLGDGTKVCAGGATYVASVGATDIPDLEGFLPFGEVTPDHWAENVAPGTTNMAPATQSAIAYGGARLRKNSRYAFDGGADVTTDDRSLFMPVGSSIVALSATDNPIDVQAARFTLYGEGEIDCASIVSGVAATSAAVGLKVRGISIKNPTSRGITCDNNFSDTEEMEISGARVYWDSAGAAAVAQSIIPLTINLQGTGSTDVQNVLLLNNIVDMSQWTKEDIALMGYPSTGNPNTIGIRVNQSGSAGISDTVRISGNKVVMPVATELDEWNPTNYGQPADTAGQRRPTCVEVVAATASSNDAIVENNNVLGGDLGLSMGRAGRLNFNSNTMRFQTSYCGEFASSEEVTGAGNLFDGVNALRPCSTTNCRIVNLPGSHIVGPKDHSNGQETAFSTTGTTELVNFSGSTFIAVEDNFRMISLVGTAANQIVNLSGCMFIGTGITGCTAIQTRTGTIETLNLTGANFRDIDTNMLDVPAGTVITNLIEVGISAQNASGVNIAGTVTNRFGAFNNASGFTGNAVTLDASTSPPSLDLEAGSHNWNYGGVTWASFRADDITFLAPTADASDTGSVLVSGGGNTGQFRGGTLWLYGNEHASAPGEAMLESGVNRDVTIKSNGVGDVVLDPAGTGSVKFGTHAAIGAETVTGYIEIQDSGGTLRRLAVVS